ncbi:uncharacterized protein LOC128613513 isoform X1 [Ictalurus furcatus]|uniref:uncharacterized protein LOC128613513 isoform X1 n=1 Tax=Ictalurus furcatus TaxID=66913 RepID=UPI002350F300|nr:uncharacterized protein LOC128613513 isoform X1 [Ictalurus furcatus]
MDYLFNRNFLLLLTVGAIINARVQGTLIEPEVPKMVKACTGSHTTISCTFHTDVKGLKVTWYFDKTSDFNDRKKIKELHSPPGSHVSHYHEENGRTASYLTIRNVTLNDSGWYFCQVTQDIPILISNLSNGSELVISPPTECNVEDHTTNSSTIYDSPTDSNLEDSTKNSTTTYASEPPNASPWWLWVAVAGGCVLIITAAITTTVICRRKKEAPVYENTKEASKRHWKEDKYLHHGMPSKGYSHKQMDTLKPHKHEYVHNGRKPSPKL